MSISTWAEGGDSSSQFQAESKPQRGGRKRRRKVDVNTSPFQDWSDIYDPSRPNVYEDYKGCEEQEQEAQDWKDKLHTKTLRRKAFGNMKDFESSSIEDTKTHSFDGMAAPVDDGGGDAQLMQARAPSNRAIEANTSFRQRQRSPSNDNIASPCESSYATSRRLPRRSSLPGLVSSWIPSEPVKSGSPTPTPQRLSPHEQSSNAAQLKGAADRDVLDDPQDSMRPETQRSLRPGQKGFAERLMAKYGWTKGSGLGASGSGIVDPLRVQLEKRQKKADGEGRGWAAPSAKGKIIAAKYGQVGPAGSIQESPLCLSEVIVLYGMLDGLDLDFELGESNLMQEIGEEHGDKYGRVERVFIDRDSVSTSIPVFIKFTSQLSALRAVQAIKGTSFRGNVIRAEFFDTERFEAGLF